MGRAWQSRHLPFCSYIASLHHTFANDILWVPLPTGFLWVWMIKKSIARDWRIGERRNPGYFIPCFCCWQLLSRMAASSLTQLPLTYPSFGPWYKIPSLGYSSFKGVWYLPSLANSGIPQNSIFDLVLITSLKLIFWIKVLLYYLVWTPISLAHLKLLWGLWLYSSYSFPF